MTTQAEHLAWCKARALALLADPVAAYASMSSDIVKHEQFRNDGTQMVLMLGMAELASGRLRRPDAMRRWIEGWA